MSKRRKILMGLSVVIALILGFAGYSYYSLSQLFETIDNTVVHGDACLDEKQGENYRCWDIFVPELQDDDSVPLVIDIHGYFNSPETQKSYSNFQDIADEEKFIVVQPYGIDYSWNGGGKPWLEKNKPAKVKGEGCCGAALFYGIDDVSYFLDMIQTITQKHPVNSQKIYLSGFSTGCVMAQRLVSEHSELFAGLACMAGSVMVDAAPTYTPIPIMEIRGSKDTTSTYETDYWLGAKDNFETWKIRNNCQGAVETVWQQDDHVMIQADECTNDATVAQVTIMGASHQVYKDASKVGIDVTRMAWDFLKQN